VFSPPAIPTGEDFAAIIVAGFFGQLKKPACRVRAVEKKHLAVFVECLKEVFILFHFVFLLHSFLISGSRLVLSYGYIIYCNTVYVKGLSKYFIKNKNKSPHKWDRNVPEMSPIKTGEAAK
jgi:hypothetical protein